MKKILLGIIVLFWLNCGQHGPVLPQGKGLAKPVAGFADVPAETFRNQLAAEVKKILQLLDSGARTDGGLPTFQTWTVKFGTVQQTSSVGFVWAVLSRAGKVLEKPWIGLFFDDTGHVTGTAGMPYIVFGIINPGEKSTWALFALSDIATDLGTNATTFTFTQLKTGLSVVEEGVQTVIADIITEPSPGDGTIIGGFLVGEFSKLPGCFLEQLKDMKAEPFVKGLVIDMEVPSRAEIVIEGRLECPPRFDPEK